MRKICRVFFSRYFISAALILAELVLLGYILFWAYEYSWIALLFFAAVNAAALISLINRDANPEYKVSWLAVITVLPPFGAALYSIFYSRRLSRKNAEFMRRIYDNLDDFRYTVDGKATKGEEEFGLLHSELPLAAGKAHAILNDDRLANIYLQSSSRFFSSGEDMFESILEDLSKAKKYVFLEYFIIEEGKMWDRIHALLKQKVREGVEVRLLYDDIGCMKTLPARYDRRLCAEGIKCKRFSPVSPRISTAHNNRDHRKILIVDGRVAYTGGINIADEYINRKKRFGYWKDGGIRIEGEAVLGFLKLFLSSWDFTAGSLSEVDKYSSDVIPAPVSDGGFYIPFGSGPAPVYERPVGKNALLNLINQAEKYLYITTPYLIVDYDLTESLRNAALRGVDVRIITPGVADKKLIKIMTKSSYPYLMRAGVRIYEYARGFIHEKTILSDDLYAIVGTINLDYRSLVHHFEDAVWMCGTPTVRKIREEFIKTVSVSNQKDSKAARLTPLEWIVRNLIRIFAPLL
ncbi:MAG: cardiolipin synthase [Ruminococcaceae bacterium]|nr:cardiolipin synthase [Oscillospiraceae bacterium]